MKRPFKIGDLVVLEDEAKRQSLRLGLGLHGVGVVVRYADTWINLMEHPDLRWALGKSNALRCGHPRGANMWYRRDEWFVVLWPGGKTDTFKCRHLKKLCEEVPDEQAL